MNVAIGMLLTSGVIACWIAALSFARLRTPLERIHAVSFANIAGGAMLTLAAMIGSTPAAAAKCALIWLLTVIVAALLSHVTGRALLLRDGERR